MSETLLAVILLAPLLAAVVPTLLGTSGMGRQSHWPCLLGLFVAAAASIGLLIDGEVLHGPVELAVMPWFSAGTVDIAFGLRADALSAIMLATVTGVSFLVAVYSVGYMHGAAGYSRYFAAISLFVFSMTLLVTAGDFVVLYLAWEAVGVCSYLLVGFYQDRPDAAAAARKAFLVNRVGDFGFLLGIFWLLSLTAKAAPVGSSFLTFETVFLYANRVAVQDPTGLTIACLLLFCGAVGKSAQFPLHTWLPDAMEGPSPVSALIHAATMVTAGVYLVARLTPVLAFSPETQLVIAGIGGFTALFAAAIALTQYDLKRVLAYSTVSQLGYMFLALGCAGAGTDPALPTMAVTAAMFHLFTHAFFKALLFLSAGSVMHSMGDVIDMRRFSGLRRVLPLTHVAFLCGAVALAGLPIFSGFWSKDAILDVVSKASEGGKYAQVYGVLYGAILLTSLMTAFYTFRAYFMTFFGETKLPPEAGEHPHEAPAVMLGPLFLLSLAALGIGVLVGPGLKFDAGPLLPKQVIVPEELFAHFLQHTPGLAEAAGHETKIGLMILSGAIALAGFAFALQCYVLKPGLPAQLTSGIQPVVEASLNRFYVDELYERVFVRPLEAVAAILPRFDRHWLDKFVQAFGAIPGVVGRWLRPLQNGMVQSYGVWMLLGLGFLIAALASTFRG